LEAATVSMLKQRDGDPEVSKAEIEFNRVQKVEDQFHKDFDGDFDGLDSTYADCTGGTRQFSISFFCQYFLLEFIERIPLLFIEYSDAIASSTALVLSDARRLVRN
jgi:hypothetical protein